MQIHETAIVGQGVRFGKDVTVGAFSIIGDGVEIGDGSVLLEHVVVRKGSVLGRNGRVHGFALIGEDPQDFKFDEHTESGVRIGDDFVVREGVTIHRATGAGECTLIGKSVYLMANSHVAHDCRVGDHVTLANGALLAGHATVHDHTMISGNGAVHQYARIGEGVMIGGNSTATYDVPPFTMIAERNGLRGLNVVGLRRRGASREELTDLKRCYHEVYRGGDPRERAARALASGEFGTTIFGRKFLEFFEGGTRGFVRPLKGG